MDQNKGFLRPVMGCCLEEIDTAAAMKIPFTASL